jgi:hypothetical protein
MIPIKIQCGCGQEYAFEIEPLQGKMPNAVECPACGADGTTAANQSIAEQLAAFSESASQPSAGPPLPKSNQRRAIGTFVRLVGPFCLGIGVLLILAEAWVPSRSLGVILILVGSALSLLEMYRRPDGRHNWISAIAGTLCGALLGGVIGTLGFVLLGDALFGGALDQGALLIFITGPLGVTMGAVAGGLTGLGKRRAAACGWGALAALPFGGLAFVALWGVLFALGAPVAGGSAAWIAHRYLTAAAHVG